MDKKPSVGYLGMGIMGTAMAGRLIDAGFPVTVWNRSRDKCTPMEAKGAKVAETAQEVMETCDVTFACTSDPTSARAVVFGEKGVLAGITKGKRFVDMSTVDEECVKEIAEAITAKGGRFLEAPVSGSKGPALQGQLVILAAGEAALHKEVQQCFDVLGKKTFFLGEVGCGARMKLVINMVMGINMVALSEGLAVGQKAGLQGKDILEVIKEGAIASPMYGLKGPKMLEGDFAPNFPLKHQQKDVRLAVDLGDKVGQSMPLAAAANEAFKAARAAGKGDEDFSAVFATVNR
ncbi:GLYR1 [Symbiodinium pilosum]|uniref:GLYR1 protein n=1 Tax=Symbiodinium pilosum TaxID=2952 RepID=A0A812U799_SYMPI|nr:GLYR1 [Symbiodinium pilosum]